MPPHGRRRAGSSLVTLFASLVLLFAWIQPTLAASSVLGIDLGTEYIKAALVKPGIPLEIVLTKDTRRKEAATIAFKPVGRTSSSANGVFPERAYGADAIALAARFPSDVYPNLKPLLGVSTHATAGEENPLISVYQARHPGLALQQCSAERDTVCLRSNTFAPEEEPFSIEELLAMQLQNVRGNAEAMAGKDTAIKDVVITVPPFWTADEKRAVETAAQLAGLRVLAMTTDGLAVGLHYATTRTFPMVTNGEKAEHHMVFDMGAGSTTATVMRFQGRNVKDVGKYNKTVQEIQVLGAGWDTTLGGDAFNQLLLDDIVQQLANSKPMKELNAGVNEIHKHGRTMAKLWKEAQRLRQVLSANTQTQATMEGLYNGDVNFKYKISRSHFEKLAAGAEERVKDTVLQALKMADLDLKDLDSVILHGGATRTPFVQKALESAVKDPALVKTPLNSDESAAFGAAFRAASISSSFRVKEIRTSEAAIQAVEMKWSADGKEHNQQIFVPSSQAGKEKEVPVKAFDEFSTTFAQIASSGNGESRKVPITKVETTNLTAAVKELKDKYGCESTDVTTQFFIRVDPETSLPEVTRGSVSCEGVEEKKAAGVMDGVKNLFGFGSKDEQAPLKESEDSPAGNDDSSLKGDASATTSSKKTQPTSTESDSKKSKDATPQTAPEEPVRKIHVVYVGTVSEEIGLPRVQGLGLKAMRDRMKAFDQSDKDRRRRETALNELEAYAYKVRDLVEDADFIAASTKELRADLAKKAQDTGEWIYGDGSDAKLEDFQTRLKELKGLVKPVLNRKTEASQRENEVKDFRSVLNSTKVMIENILRTNAERKEQAESSSSLAAAASSAAAASPAANPEASSADADDLDALDDTTGDSYAASADEPFKFELPLLSEEQVGELEKSYESAKTWLDEKLAAQEKLPATVDPAFTVAELKKKAADLQNAAIDMLTKQMESSKKKAKKPKKSSKSKTKKAKKTSDGSATESPSGSASTEAADAKTTLTKDEL